jgi:hypothetical protein
LQVEQRRVVNPDKPLPTARTTPEDFEFGHQEPDVKKVALGKCTLRQAIQFISDHQQQPNEWTAKRIAEEFKMKQENVDQILQHFRMFQVHINTKTAGKSKKFLLDPFSNKTKDFDKLLADATATTKPAEKVKE